MKTVLLTLVFCSLSFFTFGQLSYSPSKTYTYTCGLNELGYYDGIEFTNGYQMNVNVDWQLIEFDTVPGCMFDMCASGACLYKVPATGNFPVLAPNQTGWLKLHIGSGNNPGINTIRFVINESGGHAPDTLTFIITVLNNVSVDENKKEAFEIYPNPFSNELKIRGTSRGTITLFDCNGQPVWEENNLIPNGNLPVSALSRGIYFLRVTDEQGKISSKKIVKN